jgi:hypothetical protein
MKRLSLIALVAVLSLAFPVCAQQASSPVNAAVAPVDQHLKMLAEKLDLTADQQEKARPILQQLHDDSQKIADDKSLSHEELMEKMHPVFMKADKALREFLTDEQKTKLDTMEQQMHPQHGASAPQP